MWYLIQLQAFSLEHSLTVGLGDRENGISGLLLKYRIVISWFNNGSCCNKWITLESVTSSGRRLRMRLDYKGAHWNYEQTWHINATESDITLVNKAAFQSPSVSGSQLKYYLYLDNTNQSLWNSVGPECCTKTLGTFCLVLKDQAKPCKSFQRFWRDDGKVPDF